MDGSASAGSFNISVDDKGVLKISKKSATQRAGDWVTENVQRIQRWASEYSWSTTYQTILSQALGKIAYDTATWIGSGSRGQKPMFVTEGWGPYLSNIGDNAAGSFIEAIGRSGMGGDKFNLCSPNLDVQLTISLGLINKYKPRKPACTFSQMVKNWDKEVKGLSNIDFMKKFQDMFNPQSNQLGIALTLESGVMREVAVNEQYGTLERLVNRGWTAVKDMAGDQKSIPDAAGDEVKTARQLMIENFANATGNALADSAKIFVNQLAITLVNEQLKKIGSKRTTSPFGGWPNLTNPSAGPSSSGAGGIAAVKEQLRKIIEPKFNTRGDYNILSELTQCQNPNKAGPTNCVIDEKFRSAIAEKKSVGVALKEGSLKNEGIFGYATGVDLEPSYMEGYPYRSIIILRKFRILPVGWEVAAQYIKNNPTAVKGTKNLGDLVACFDRDDTYQGYYEPWCEGLVDPNWVLKAPQNYCRREGPGPEIISSSVSGEGSESELAIVRNDKYCADEQSCIKEKEDGSCQLYGYCTEERRKWSFGAKDCEPKYNTCQTFKSEGGQTISYLENTLDYEGCSVDNAGCKAYCANYDYTNGRFACTSVSTDDRIYLDRDVESCDAENEGCHEFTRAQTGLGANLLINSSFEEDLSVGVWSGFGATTSDSYDGLIAMVLPAGASARTVPVGPDTTYIGGGFNIGGNPYTLSLYAKNCASSTDSFQINGQAGVTGLGDGTAWQYYQTTFIVPRLAAGNQIILNFNRGAASGCTIDAIKLENGYKATAYNEYNNNQKVYEKLMPDYLFDACFEDRGTYFSSKEDAPAECDNFARRCKFEEVGCESFTSKRTGMSVPAKVVAQDYCVAECNGFDAYMQSETYFDSQRNENFIPKSAKACSAVSAGCDQFTNLDEVAKGGEGIEYYSTLRQCVKPSATACNEFYTWEGSNETGFQLRVVSLNFEGVGAGVEPVTTSDDSDECNADIYNRPATDPSYDPDCREFYNESGEKSYHLYDLTISCNENCHPYRRTEVNSDPSITTQADCNNLDAASPSIDNDTQWDDKGTADAGDDECYVCENGGTYDMSQRACIYDAVPKEGRSCSAAAAGCREYTGNVGRNERIVINQDFEDGTRGGFTAVGATVVSTSNESVTIGGRSLGIAGAPYAAVLDISTLVQSDKSYVLGFVAKTGAVPGASQLTFRIGNDTPTSTDFDLPVTGLGSEWQYYGLNLSRIGHPIDATEKLRIEANGNFFIDNIRLVEIVDRYYLIKNSWQTPSACNRDLAGNPSALYMLGCNQYADRDNKAHYLKSFTYLCNESAVGCEALIDTRNSSDPRQEIFNDDPPIPPLSAAEAAADDKTIPADGYIYAVYDKSKLCNEKDKGCERLGKPYYYESDIVYQDAYLKNDPDKYRSIMCTVYAERCEEYSSDDGLAYFKDPADQICEWRQGYQADWGWYRKKIKRCNATGTACLENKDCIAPVTCQAETSDQLCDIEATESEPPKTFGFGGDLVSQPAGGWAGICPAEMSGCGELIDPVSKFYSNLAYNGDFSQNVDNLDPPQTRDGWQMLSPTRFRQQTKLENYGFYRLAGRDSVPGNILTLSCSGGSGNGLYQLNVDNNVLVFSGMSISLNLTSQPQSAYFFVDLLSTCGVEVSSINPASTEVELKKVAIDYQLKKELDEKSCNGTVNFDDGCVLFNQRVQDGSRIKSLLYDADNNSTTPLVISPADDRVDSNVLLKVTPDRVCDKWLACKSKIGIKNENNQDENVCLGIGICNSVDSNGNCNNFVFAGQNNQTFGSMPTELKAKDVSNLSGYSKAGYPANDFYPLGSMEQAGEAASINNGNFEITSGNTYPLGWTMEATSTVWNSTYFKVLNDPFSIQKEGVGEVPEGRGFLKIGTAFNVRSDFFDVNPNTTYVLTAYANTVNLSTGAARITITNYNSLNQPVGANTIIDTAAGKPWQFILRSFTTPVGATKATVFLSEVNNPQGNIYFDEIKIAPALETRSLLPAGKQYTPQTCRLYPEADALSCKYYDDSGIIKKGLNGYCLEYDRYPGSDKACLMWWPVDRVNGDGVAESYGGYGGKYPVYYCDNVDGNFQVVEARKQVFLRSETKSSWTLFAWGMQAGLSGFVGVSLMALVTPNGTTQTGTALNQCPMDSPAIPNGGYRITTTQSSGGNMFKKKTTISYYCTPNATPVVASAGVTWYPYNGNLVKFSGGDGLGFDETKYGVMIYDRSTGLLVKPEDYQIKCGKVQQTVNASGQNKAWLGRVYEGSDYRVSGLDYAYDADDRPFGSAVVPRPQNNPYEWDGSSLDGNNPIPLLSESSGQVRAGSPYSCAGVGCSNLGLCSISNDVCLFAPENSPTSSSTNPSMSGVDNCDINDVKPCYTNWKQNVLPCPTGEICDVDKYNLDLPGNPLPEDNLRRVFAKSYGTWDWSGTEGVCANNAAMTCTNDGNQCPGGTCTAHCKMNYQRNKVYNAGSPPPAYSPDTCVITNPTSCDGIIYDGRTELQWNTDNTCELFASVCGAAGITCINNRCCNMFGTVGCIAGTESACCCNPLGTGGCVAGTEAECCIGGNGVAAQAARDTCVDYYTTSAPARVCSITGDSCSTDANCEFNAECEYGSCSGGAQDQNYCTAAQTCAGSYCVLSNTNSGRYTPVTGQTWDVPAQRCPVSGRPAIDFSTNADYCGIPPTITNIRVNGVAATSTINNNSQINLTFNSIIDKNQLPLAGYRVDWGDGETTVISGVEMLSKPDPINPHVLYHIYDYWDLKKKRAAGQTSIDCSVANRCVVKPKIHLEDNWGWCNEGKATPADPICPNDSGVANTYYSGAVDDGWQEFINAVEVIGG